MNVPAGFAPHHGMPPLDLDADRPLSRFEFWPPALFYLPVWLWVGALVLRYGGLRVALLANPLFAAGGLVGESKAEVLDAFTGEARDWIAPYIMVEGESGDAAGQAARALDRLHTAGLQLPVVAKPDLGCRGAGVRPIRAPAELETYLRDFPVGQRLLLQRMADVEGEAGVFYMRRPGGARGEIFSLTLKYFPYVCGDGRSTLRELILADPRAGRLSHLYLPRHAARLDKVVAQGEAVRLAFAGSHSRGAIFRNGQDFVTEAMRARFEAIATGAPEFRFGRFDVRFADIEALRRGEDFTIIECNGAGAEATHIWDSRTRLRDAYATLFRQYGLLWAIGAENRRRGFRAESWGAFIRRWRNEKRLVTIYPSTQ